MKVLICHNYYRQPGGEDAEFLAEKAMLVEAGHCVLEFTRRNDEISEHNLFSKAKLGLGTTWARNSVDDLRAVLREEKPDIVHFHNTFPLISPGAYYVCQDAGVPVIQTLQNYRLLCPAATLYRDGRICEECLDRGVFHGVVHGCYRDSRPATAAVGLMLALHRRINTWTEMVDRYIAPTEFVGRKFVQAGLPADRISIKPNLVHPDPGMRARRGGYALYVGRLAPEKGVGTLLRAWALLENPVPLRIVGDGPIRAALEAQRERSNLSNVHFDGWLCREKLASVMKGAAFLIFPSEWHEPFGLTIVEAFACGVPVIASRLDSITEMLEEEKTGLYFTPREATELAAKVDWAWRHPHAVEMMSKAARAQYQAKYTAERNYAMLMEIYGQARRSSVTKICKQYRSVSPMIPRLNDLSRKWQWLTSQEGFRRAPVSTCARLISWRGRCLLGKAAIVNLRRWNIPIFLPPRWRGIEKLVFVFRENYEPELIYLEKVLSSKAVFIDVGANLGIYTLVASRLVGRAGRVIAIEPSVQSFPALQKNIAVNRLTNVLPLPVALAEKTAKTWLHHGINPGQNSFGKDPSCNGVGEEVVTETLDSVLLQASVDHVDLIKMDVEGAEELVLRGASRVVTSERPLIIFEFNPEAAQRLGLSPSGAWNLLEALNYEFFMVGPRGSLQRSDSPLPGRNVVAIPRQG